MNNPHFIIDIKTLARTPRAVITEAGAVFADLNENKYNYIHLHINAEGQFKSRDTDSELIKQRKETGSMWQVNAQFDLERSMEIISIFISDNLKDGDSPTFWSKGKEFDFSILNNAYSMVKKESPFDFRKTACLRSLTALAPDLLNIPFKGKKYNTLDDACHGLEILKAFVTEKMK